MAKSFQWAFSQLAFLLFFFSSTLCKKTKDSVLNCHDWSANVSDYEGLHFQHLPRKLQVTSLAPSVLCSFSSRGAEFLLTADEYRLTPFLLPKCMLSRALSISWVISFSLSNTLNNLNIQLVLFYIYKNKTYNNFLMIYWTYRLILLNLPLAFVSHSSDLIPMFFKFRYTPTHVYTHIYMYTYIEYTCVFLYWYVHINTITCLYINNIYVIYIHMFIYMCSIALISWLFKTFLSVFFNF